MGLGYADVFVLVVLVLVILAYVRRQYGEVEYVKSRVDGRAYLCLKLANRAAAADLLARVNARLQRLVAHVHAKFKDDAKLGAAARRLHANFNPDAISEGGNEAGYTSYSLNKGERIILCVRNDDKVRSFVPINTVVYVAVHELGHLATESVGHEPEFWANFKWLLAEAVAIGLYTKVDYAVDKEPYCGIELTSSVL
jgi:hypothetical protein